MSSNKLVSLLAGIIFLIVAAVSLYRLLFYFPITVGGHAISQTATFFSFAIFTALTLIALRNLKTAN